MTLKVFMTEPKKTDYVFIDENGNLHVLLPIAGGDTIATDNTCKMHMELSKFLGLKEDDKKPVKSAQTLLREYEDALNEDIQSLTLYKPNDKRLEGKIKRLAQVKEYLALIAEIQPIWQKEFIKKYDLPDYLRFNEAINKLFNKKTNLLAIRLSPKDEDRRLMVDQPLFSLARKPRNEKGAEESQHYEGLGPTLRKVFLEQLQNKNKKYNGFKEQIIDEVIVRFEHPKKWNDQLIKDLQGRLEDNLKKKSINDVNCKKTSQGELINLAYFEAIYGDDFQKSSPADVVNSIWLASISVDLRKSLFTPASTINIPEKIKAIQREKLLKQSKLYLDEIYSYCRANRITNMQSSFTSFFERDANKAEIEHLVSKCIEKKIPIGSALFTLINEKHIHNLGLVRALTPQDKLALLELSIENNNVAVDRPLKIVELYLDVINDYCKVNMQGMNYNIKELFNNALYKHEIDNIVANYLCEQQIPVGSALFGLVNKNTNIIGLTRTLTTDDKTAIFETYIDKNVAVSNEQQEPLEKESDQLSIKTQFFIAEINIYCYANKLLGSSNFGITFDKEPYSTEIANTVFNSISQGESVESALFALINSQKYKTALGLIRELSKAEQSIITNRCSVDYNTISESPHFDEFCLCLPELAGDFFTYKGRISAHMADLLLPTEKNNYTRIVEAATQLKAKNRRALPSQKSEQDFIEIEDDAIKTSTATLITYLQEGQFDLVRQLLFTKNSPKHCLADLLQANGNILKKIINTKQIHGKDTSDTAETTLLINAVQRNDIADVRLYLKLGAEINSADSNKQTALHHAILDNYPRIVEVLLDNHAKPYLKDAEGNDALILANSHSQDSIKLLIISAIRLTADEQQEFLINLSHKHSYPRVLIYAALVNVDIFDPSAFDELLVYLDPAQKLEEIKQLTHYLNLHPETPITAKVIKLLAESLSFASANDLKYIIESKLLIALLQAGQFDLVKNKLLEKNAEQQPFYEVLAKQNKSALAEILHTTDQNGKSLFFNAVDDEQLDVLTVYLALGANINAKDSRGNTALMRTSNAQIVALLLEKNADVCTRNNALENALETSVHFRSELVIPILLKALKLSPEMQAELLKNRRDNDGEPFQNILTYAAESYSTTFVDYIKGIEPEQITSEIEKYINLLNTDLSLRLKPDIPTYFCIKALSLSHEKTENETVYQFQERIRDIRELLLYSIKRNYSIKSNRAYFYLPSEHEYNATEDEKTYSAACIEYISHLSKEIASNPTDSVAHNKRNIVLDALRVLLTQQQTTAVEKRIESFVQVLTVNKDTLCTRRDTALTTFVKALGVLGAFIFGLGVGGYFAYQSFFGENATTKGRKLLDILPENSDNIPKV